MGVNADILKHIELLVGSIGVIISLLFGLFLLVSRTEQHKANFFLSLYLLAFSLRIGKSLFYNYFPIDPVIRNIFLGILLAIGPSLWLYVFLRKHPQHQLASKAYLWHYVPMLMFIALCWIIPNDRSSFARLLHYALIAHIILYAGYAYYWLHKNDKKSTSYRERKIDSWLRFFVTATLTVVIIYVLIMQNIIPYYMGMAFLFSAVIIAFSIWWLQTPFLFKIETQKYGQSTLETDEIVQLSGRLKQLMTSEQLYLDPDLTLGKLSKKMGISSKRLSQVINQSENINYSKFITNYRVSEAKKRLVADEYRHLKISAIAYDSGFNSLSSFNAAFKSITSTTAIAYRNASK
ncbi:AraC family transcriptional regulator [uncultured Winogradskyella sp.]|uniref:helix-turn-helix domain-containing protein n=1 Tax=uncultured Winogradskyella sp. TaxID=395353 RepID=UPI0026105384|nr:helix-turn-helix domain-containing protein [uncultured Winogradskyella sp.]